MDRKFLAKQLLMIAKEIIASPGKFMPENCYLKKLKKKKGRMIWSDSKGWNYTWDSRHGEVEVYDRLGEHLGATSPFSDKIIKPPKKGRRLNGH